MLDVNERDVKHIVKDSKGASIEVVLGMFLVIFFLARGSTFWELLALH